MEMLSTTNLIINYLPQTLTDEEFHSMFLSIGPLKASKIVRDRATGYSYGFGFVEYQKEEDAQKAANTLNGLQLQSKRIKVAPARVGENVKGANLYVRSIPRTMTQEQFAMMFAAYGNVVQSRLLKDQTTGKPKGVGFILYETKSQADAAIENLDGQVPEGGTEVMSVAYADDNRGKARQPMPFGPGAKLRGGFQGSAPRMPTRPMGGGHAMGGGHGRGYNEFGGNGYGAGGYNDYNNFSGNDAPGNFGPGPMRSNQNRFRYNPMSGPGGFGGNNPPNSAGNEEGFALFVYNIGTNATERELWQLFSPFGSVLKVNVIRDFEKNQCKGYGFVTMGAYHDAMSAIQNLNGYPYGEKPLQVSFKTAK